MNQQSGVSVRMSIANLENVVSNAERRAIIHHEGWIVPRPSDLAFAVPSSRGKLELTMTEEEGHEDKLIGRIIDEAIKNIFTVSPRCPRAATDRRLFRERAQRRAGRRAVYPQPCSSGSARSRGCASGPRSSLPAGSALRRSEACRAAAAASAAEFILEGLHVHNKLNKQAKAGGTSYRRLRRPWRCLSNIPSGMARSSSCRNRPTRSSTSSPNS